MASRSLTPTSRSRQRRTPALPSMMMDPFRLIDGLLSDVVRAGANDGGLAAPPRMNIEDAGNEIRVTVELPGVSESDLEITLEDDLLIVAGEKRQERDVDEGDMRLVERAFGRFRRAIQLPFAPDPDQVQASFRDGVLTITIPKNSEQQNRTRQIEVNRDQGKGDGSSTSSAASGSSQSGTQGDRSTGRSSDAGTGQGADTRREEADAAA
jgi:HSP20 family protein